MRTWLDPRTQAKIEILGTGPETTAKLLQYIDAATLPRRYGGTAPDWQTKRPLTEHITVARLSDARRVVSVPAGHMLVVDSYVPEGEIVVEVYTAPLQFPGLAEVEGISGKSNASVNSNNSNTSSDIKLDDLILLTKTTMQRTEGQPRPARNTQSFPNPGDQPATFLIRYSNPAMLVGRSLVVNVYTEADETLSK